MSGLIKNLKEEIGSEASITGQISTINLAIRVLAYEDGKYVIGTRVDTNEQVKVFLRDVKQNSSYDRITVETLSAQHGKYTVTAGDENSIVLFESAYQEEDGTWNARWIKVLSNKKWPSRVLSLPASVQIVPYQDKKFLSVDVIKKIIRVEDKSIENIKRVVIEGLKPKMIKMTPVVAVRLTDSIGDSITGMFYAKKEVVNENKQVMQPHQYIDELWNKERFQKIISNASNTEIYVDVIYITQMNFGADTNEKIVGNKFEVEKIKNEYLSEDNEKLYKKTILTLRERDDGSLFLTLAEPVQNGNKGISIDNI